ncbi:hypothetical protein [Flavobacterium phage FCV-1]|uniref:Uncharacterized protein n=10 Tax=Ficleduovirus FCV1 TaxID=2560474 RepID=A0A218M8L2_9CAUD|nr:hypothetical protein FDG55_gp64 [Flavobacterium phage FCV-1]ASD51646.1 hypothetical protein [Flavobacterium phage FCV-3]ASD51720.1 hypothetical protein [Flavobacterium phage FCV-11]ASD52550.1 hypothetical protein [Flavobacterium phage FCV-10]ASD52623.1 hypothetical protein [Flavobacterium phage FCV-16]ASD52697.1 hypothetical protein [Flavobacterium phage FCV-20]ASD53084.1 hypothetical protein [Flavobacterium phage VK20]ASD53158.1 hypothetical protein [Flavobacterium phage VK42]ASD53308.1
MAYKERTCKLSGVVWKQYNSFQKCTCSLCLESKPKPKLKWIQKVCIKIESEKKNGKQLTLNL